MQITPRDLLQITPSLLVVAVGLAVLLLDACWPKIGRRWLAMVTLAGLAAVAGVQLALWPRGNVEPIFGRMITIDALTAYLTLLAVVGTAVSVLLAAHYLEREGTAYGEYYALLLFTAFGGIVMAAATNLVVLFIGLEILSISLYILAGYHRERTICQEAALKYFLLGAFASAFLVYGMALTYGDTGTLEFQRIATAAIGAPSPLLLAGIGLMLVGFAFKVALVPFHLWTPDVYEGAPTSATAFMAVLAKLAGFAALLRIVGEALPGQEVRAVMAQVVSSLAILTMVLGNMAAIVQANIKRMLAYSSIAHAGYIAVGLAAMLRNPLAPGDGIVAVLFYLAVYLSMTLGAFGVVIAFRRRGEELLTIDDYAGLGYRYPWLGALMALFMLSLAGMPPTAGFLGKLYLLRAAAAPQVGTPWVPVILVLTSVVSFGYYLRIVTAMYMRPAEEGETAPAAQVSVPLAVGLAVCAIGTLLLGVAPGAVLQTAQAIADSLIDIGMTPP